MQTSFFYSAYELCKYEYTTAHMLVDLWHCFVQAKSTGKGIILCTAMFFLMQSRLFQNKQSSYEHDIVISWTSWKFIDEMGRHIL